VSQEPLSPNISFNFQDDPFDLRKSSQQGEQSKDHPKFVKSIKKALMNLSESKPSDYIAFANMCVTLLTKAGFISQAKQTLEQVRGISPDAQEPFLRSILEVQICEAQLENRDFGDDR